jgi:hypothetical protein
MALSSNVVLAFGWRKADFASSPGRRNARCCAERRPGAVPVINIDKLFTILDLRVFAAPPEDHKEVVGPRISSDSDPCLTEALLDLVIGAALAPGGRSRANDQAY